MRVLIPVLEPVHKNCDIIALVLDTDMNYDSNTPYNVITKIQRQTLMILLRIMGLYIWDIWKPLLVHIIRITFITKVRLRYVNNTCK